MNLYIGYPVAQRRLKCTGSRPGAANVRSANEVWRVQAHCGARLLQLPRLTKREMYNKRRIRKQREKLRLIEMMEPLSKSVDACQKLQELTYVNGNRLKAQSRNGVK